MSLNQKEGILRGLLIFSETLKRNALQGVFILTVKNEKEMEI